MRIAQEEIFGPVLVVIPFDTEEEAVEIANDTIYGLAAGIWTRDVAKAMWVVNQIRAGMVWVNTFHGCMDRDAVGRIQAERGRSRLGSCGLEEFTEPKSVIVDTTGEPVGMFEAVND